MHADGSHPNGVALPNHMALRHQLVEKRRSAAFSLDVPLVALLGFSRSPLVGPFADFSLVRGSFDKNAKREEERKFLSLFPS